MIESIVAVVGAVLGLFLFQAFNRHNTSKRQAELEAEVKNIQAKADKIQSKIDADEKKTQEQVDAITKEQSENPTGSDLASWFQKRSGK